MWAPTPSENGSSSSGRCGTDPTLLVIDNVESILPPYGWAAGAGGEEPAGFDPDLLEEILELCRKLVETGGTSLVFTSRSPLPAPFDDRGRELDVGRLSKSEALELVGKVLGEGGRIPGTRTDLESREKVEELVEALGGHARSLVLVARELRGGRRLNDTTADVRQIMADLHRRFPNDREQSLFASVELSLRKLPPELRAKLPPLGVFHGGGHVVSIGYVLGLDLNQGEHEALARALIDVGLAECCNTTTSGSTRRWGRSSSASWTTRRERPPRPAGRRQQLSSRCFFINSELLTHNLPPCSHFTSCPTSWRRSSGARDARRAARSAWSR